MVQLTFDANTVEPNAGMEPVPDGWYNVAIAETEMKPTSNGQGAFLQIKMSIIDGQFANKVIFTRLNLQNQNQQAVDIAYGELSAICHCVGVFQVQDSSQLHGIPFQVRVNVRPAGTGADGKSYDASNEVKGYRDAAGNEPGKAPVGGGAPGNFGGAPTQQPTQQQPAQQPAQQQASNAQGGGWGAGQPPQEQPVQQQPVQQQPQTQPAQQQPAQGGNAGWTQPAQDQGGQPAQNGAPWGQPSQ